MSHSLLIGAVLSLHCLLYFCFSSSITKLFCGGIFEFIFRCTLCFFLLEQNFKISKTEVAKISFALLLLKSNRIWKTYHVKDLFPIGVTKLLFFLPNEVFISIYIFYMNNIFLFHPFSTYAKFSEKLTFLTP